MYMYMYMYFHVVWGGRYKNIFSGGGKNYPLKMWLFVNMVVAGVSEGGSPLGAGGTGQTSGGGAECPERQTGEIQGV